jgi:hypothetical protein
MSKRTRSQNKAAPVVPAAKKPATAAPKPFSAIDTTIEGLTNRRPALSDEELTKIAESDAFDETVRETTNDLVDQLLEPIARDQARTAPLASDASRATYLKAHHQMIATIAVGIAARIVHRMDPRAAEAKFLSESTKISEIMSSIDSRTKFSKTDLAPRAVEITDEVCPGCAVPAAWMATIGKQRPMCEECLIQGIEAIRAAEKANL